MDDDEPYSWVIGAVCYSLGVCGLMHMSIDTTDSEPFIEFGWIVAGAAVLLAVAYVAFTGFWRQWVFWIDHTDEHPGLGKKTSQLIISVATIGTLFVAINSMLVASGHADVSGSPDPNTIVGDSLQFFGLQLLNSVPVLDLVDTFELRTNVTYRGTTNAVMLTTFRLLLLVPATNLLMAIIRHRPRRRSSDWRTGPPAS